MGLLTTVKPPALRERPDGLPETRTYDLQGRLTQQTLGAVDTRTATYDPAGNLTQLVSAGTATYTYDALHRLLTEQSPAATQTFTYDANGNRLSDGIATATYVPQANRLATLDGVTVPHDAAGNRTGYGAQTLAYDQPGRLATVTELVGGTPVTVAQAVYDARGQRRVRTTTTGTVVAHYDPTGRLLAETQADGTLVRRYVWGAAGPLAQRGRASDGTLQLTLLHPDHLGTPRLGTDATGTVVWRWDSDAFGQALPDADPDGDGLAIDVTLRFPGQVYDTETGLHYNYFRDYDPMTGRYLESDPIGLRGGLNTYGYVAGNSLSAIDPLGLDLVLVGDGGDLGSLLNLAAKTWDEENGGGNEIVEVSSGEEALEAMKAYAKKHGGIDGLRVFAHSGNNGIYFNQVMWRGSLYSHGSGYWWAIVSGEAARMQSIKPDWFLPDATIDLRGCKAGKGENSFAQQLADHLHLPVLASPVGTQFTGIPGGKPGQGLPEPVPAGYTPIYMVPDGGAKFQTIRPRQ